MSQSLGKFDDALQGAALIASICLFFYVWYLAITSSAGWVIGFALGWIPAGAAALALMLVFGLLFSID